MSIGHLIVILVIIMVLFGAKKVPNVMKDIARGFKTFRDELNCENSSSKEADK